MSTTVDAGRAGAAPWARMSSVYDIAAGDGLLCMAASAQGLDDLLGQPMRGAPQLAATASFPDRDGHADVDLVAFAAAIRSLAGLGSELPAEAPRMQLAWTCETGLVRADVLLPWATLSALGRPAPPAAQPPGQLDF
jgi:hypothetical protein